MPLDQDELASDLGLDKSDAHFQKLYAQLDRWFTRESQGLEYARRKEVERLLRGVVQGWRGSMDEKDTVPTTLEQWKAGVESILTTAGQKLANKRDDRASVSNETTAGLEAQLQHREKMDREAEQKNLPQIELYREKQEMAIKGEAGLDKVVAAKLENPDDTLMTESLASCTGVSLFDPQTKVGAIMHIYKGEVTVKMALEKMKEFAPITDHSRIQVGILPGYMKGWNTGNQHPLQSQLSEVGIVKVRDFAAEGRTGTSLFLNGTGKLMADFDADVVKKNLTAPEQEPAPDKLTVREKLRSMSVGPVGRTEGVEENLSSTSNLKRSASEPSLRANRYR